MNEKILYIALSFAHINFCASIETKIINNKDWLLQQITTAKKLEEGLAKDKKARSSNNKLNPLSWLKQKKLTIKIKQNEAKLNRTRTDILLLWRNESFCAGDDQNSMESPLKKNGYLEPIIQLNYQLCRPLND